MSEGQMGFFDNRRDETLMGPYILSELRDLRKGMEGRDGELRGEITAVRDAVATLSESMGRSHVKTESILADVDTMTTNLKKLRFDVDAMQRDSHANKVEKDAAWSGPKKAIGVLVAVASAIGAATVIVKAWPAILLFLM
jgi:outer membrane murein-binding lipoprotein Lpp